MPDSDFPLRVVVEGTIDAAVVIKLLDFTGFGHYDIKVSGGKSGILDKLGGYNQSARYGYHWLVVLDLDQSAECVPEYLCQILPYRSGKMNLRLAVHAIESWLMADHVRMERFTGIRSASFPHSPDEERDPKQSLIKLVATKCRKRQLKADLLPVPGSGRRAGPNYAFLLRQFALEHWRPEVAARRSDSLARCIRALEELRRQSAR